jgi:hypothetical protein
MEGVRYTLTCRLVLVPFAGLVGRSAANTLTLTSESWLGREPTFDDCLTFMTTKGWIIDNGC